MRLVVRFVDDVQPVLVGEFIPPRIVRVVGCPHRVDVVLLHEPDVGDHVSGAERAPRAGVPLVAVHFADRDPLAVDPEDTIDDLHAAEPDSCRNPLHDGSGFVAQLEHEGGEIGPLRRPQAWSLQMCRERRGRILADSRDSDPRFDDGDLGRRRRRSVEQSRPDGVGPALARARVVADVDPHVELGTGKVGIQVGADGDVADQDR